MKIALLLAVALASLSGHALADKLDDIKKAGVLRVAAFDSNPPFGFVDEKSRQLAGFDIDIAQALAKKLGVKLELQATNPANRIPLLTANKVDLVAANFTITDERRKQVSFSVPYFATGQKFIARKDVLKKPDDIVKLRIGVDKGTTQEALLREKYPQTPVVAYDDTPLAFAALRNGNVQAITQDDAKLLALLANAPDKTKYEISPFALTREYQGIGVPLGEARLTDFVNSTLTELEKSGEVQKIYDHWFGPKTRAPLPRDFRVGDKT
ncbi:amino acid ABC transporter substrate-binding protein, PAAT family (TC 3.A.1.3.-) [Andreprevotia lacus DSM 23236]|jgi:polar amino acid transport system substrate-binding protein|uniref:Amino acid ABC transporter substrate-binding protein, PAAT family (TC 3.A.1.3.-) n=1 Tax=Andreprevotia lacus DSM 23236 TaxID=1121001 RepID=A0A1W1XQE7_9NEIS|nr:ABC transporter substrate-binding protein [Andreprevotia lacus]SMC25738.1 amino acid ABC transporter substrate-binding protein, PAAT family (TC 3.A.1.3.-) [Andreprevotia lacus DSM 23236]